jgi:ABC-type Fe3+ transport system substrate-binding protein
MNLVEKGLLAKYQSPEREGYLEALRDKDGYWNASYLNAVTMAYNSRLLKPDEVPSSYQELLLPKWKGRMGFVLSHTEWYFAMLQVAWAKTRAVSIWRLSANRIFIRASAAR